MVDRVEQLRHSIAVMEEEHRRMLPNCLRSRWAYDQFIMLEDRLVLARRELARMEAAASRGTHDSYRYFGLP